MIKTLALLSVLIAATSAFEMHPIVLAPGDVEAGGWIDLEDPLKN